MKRIITLLIVVIGITATLNAKAQNGIDQLIRSSPGDATKLVQSFAEPVFKGFGIGLNSGWNNTAKTKKFLHVDLRITANMAQVPTSDQTFDVTKIGLSNHLQVDPVSTTNLAPTFGGDKNAATPLIDIKDDNGNKLTSFNLPKGVFNFIPTPTVQLTIGLGRNTDLTVRSTPTINFGSDGGSVNVVGFGIKHNIMQDFVGKTAKKIVPFDLAVAVNYSRINYNASINVRPDAGTTPAPNAATDFSTQKFKGSFSGFNAQAIISKKLLFFTPFLSVGYQTANTDIALTGNFPVISAAGVYTTITDPIHIKETSVSGMRADIGFQLNLSVFRIYASYSPGQYQSANAGIGFGF